MPQEKKREKKKTPTFYTTMQFWRLLAIVAVAAAVIFAVLWGTSLSARDDGDGEEHPQEEQTQEPEETGTSEEEPSGTDLDVSGVSIEGKKIILDPGHGKGVTGGTTGISSGADESDTNLAIALKLKALLEEGGATVIMTRETADAINANWELDMQGREKVITESNADMFISIHQNEHTGNPDTSGPQVFYHKQGSVGKRLAVAIQEMLNAQLKPETERIALDNEKLRILKTGTQPSCIVECGFMSNPEEDELLQTDAYQQNVAQAICDGVKLYVKRFP